MSQTYYPTVSQLDARLYAAGVISAPHTATEDQEDYASACTAAWQSWEDISGYQPFLVGAADPASTWVFDGDGSAVVNLLGGFVSISSVSLNGTARTLNTDYRTMPLNAALMGKPITYLKWGGTYNPFPALYGYAGPVSVTGLRGYCTSLSALHYEGILAIAIDSLLGESEFSKFRGIKSWKIGTDERVYDDKAYDRLRASCAGKVARALSSCRRMKVA